MSESILGVFPILSPTFITNCVFWHSFPSVFLVQVCFLFLVPYFVVFFRHLKVKIACAGGKRGRQKRAISQIVFFQQKSFLFLLCLCCRRSNRKRGQTSKNAHIIVLAIFWFWFWGVSKHCDFLLTSKNAAPLPKGVVGKGVEKACYYL